MRRFTTLVSVLLLITMFTASPFLSSSMAISELGSHGISQETTTLSNLSSLSLKENTPTTPNGLPDWIDITFQTHYFYNDSATVQWHGRTRWSVASPYNPLYNWTTDGTIEGGVWNGNPGNATITVTAKNNETQSEVVADFLNYTMENYVRFTSWPSLSIFNFTEYENTTSWVFVDSIASPTEFLNTTFHLVQNGTEFLANGFNATGIAESVTEWRVFMQWNETDSVLDFSYKIRNATTLESNTYIFSLGRALGRTTPLKFTGIGNIIVRGPYDRMIINATPTDFYSGINFPYFPIGQETFSLSEIIEYNFDMIVWFCQPISGINLERQLSTTSLARGQIITVTVTATNTGNLTLSNLYINDLDGILSGFFTLVSGNASMFKPILEAGSNVTMEYSMMAIQSGSIDLAAAIVTAIDILQNEFTEFTGTALINISAGLLPSEIQLSLISIGAVIAFIICLILYRFRRRIF
ncbi:MAG: hypothetical protein ACFFDP_00660 [Promethearchaeota archaeon]